MADSTLRGVPSPALCPDPETLLAFVERCLPPATWDSVELHLDACGECRSVVSALARTGPPPDPRDTLVTPPTAAAGVVGPPGSVALAGSPDPDRYKVVGLLGAGGMGIVLRALRTEDDRPVALKVIAGARCDAERRKRFVHEADSCRALSHPNVVRVFDFGETPDGGLYLAMEVLDGMDLGARIARRALPTDEIVRIGCAAAAGLGAAHARGIIHRDVKPSNLFLCDDGGIKILDFGVALSMNGPRLTAKDRLVGTPGYMAFEQVQGMRDEDERTDVWGLGATLYHAIAGRPPFQADSSQAVLARVARERPDPMPQTVPRWLADALLRALRKDRAKRWASMEDFSRALAAGA